MLNAFLITLGIIAAVVIGIVGIIILVIIGLCIWAVIIEVLKEKEKGD